MQKRLREQVNELLNNFADARRRSGGAVQEDHRLPEAERARDADRRKASFSRRTRLLRPPGLLGVRTDNPAAELESPRRRPKLPRTLSPREAERLIEAAAGTTPRALRDAALVELLYGAGLRVSEAVGLERAGVDLDERLVRCIGKGNKSESSRSVARRWRPCGATWPGVAPTSTAASGPSSS